MNLNCFPSVWFYGTVLRVSYKQWLWSFFHWLVDLLGVSNESYSPIVLLRCEGIRLAKFMVIFHWQNLGYQIWSVNGLFIG